MTEHELAALRSAPGNATFRDVLALVDEVTRLAAALAASEQGRSPTTLGDAEYRVLWRHAEANLRQAAVEVEQLRVVNDLLRKQLRIGTEALGQISTYYNGDSTEERMAGDALIQMSAVTTEER